MKEASQIMKQISEYRKKVGKKRKNDKTCEIIRMKYIERMVR